MAAPLWRGVAAVGFAVRLAGRMAVLAVLFLPCAATLPVWLLLFRPGSAPVEALVAAADEALLLDETQARPGPTLLLRTGLWWLFLLVATLEAAGPTFVKLGQWASSRTDLFPPYACSVLSRLQAGGRAHSFAATRALLRQELGSSVEELFVDFEREPLGVGAIAQVHRATLRAHAVPAFYDRRRSAAENAAYDGDTIGDEVVCAVKVLHPGVERLVELDLAILEAAAHVLERLPWTRWLSPLDEMRVFGAMMRQQLDLRQESRHLDVFARNFSGRPFVTFPAPIYPYVASRVLVERFEDGVPIAQFLRFGPTSDDEELARLGQRAFLEMLIADNFVHADLHPGNLMVRYARPASLAARVGARVREWLAADAGDDAAAAAEAFALALANQRAMLRHTGGDDCATFVAQLRKARSARAFRAALAALHDAHPHAAPQLVVLDAGLVATLSDANLANFLDLVHALATFDGRRVGELIVDRSCSPGTVVDRDGFVRRFHNLLQSVRATTLTLAHVRIGDLLLRAFDSVRTHHVKLEGEFVNIVISVLLIEGIGRRLDPDLDLLRSAVPLLAQRPKVRRLLFDAALTSAQSSLGGAPPPPQFGYMDPVYWNAAMWALFGKHWRSFVAMYYDETGLLQVEDLVFAAL